ncbi:MAG TPA: hypothetical protein ENI26_13155 [Methylophaga aminisulfidivorans]|uniref:Uncharacterized protein n=1 Tax=Methylophaga aminisulfidivorans TaxID=230105 RepID=A0A7C1W927_9GAMM|nr:hypothetical protein [Methylophaga aminisulfidivorans]
MFNYIEMFYNTKRWLGFIKQFSLVEFENDLRSGCLVSKKSVEIKYVRYNRGSQLRLWNSRHIIDVLTKWHQKLNLIVILAKPVH